MPGIFRRLIAIALLPLALLAGTSSATALFLCAMDGVRVARCCCPEAWAEPSEQAALHRAPCCEFDTVTVASQPPTPPSSSVALVVPVVVEVPLHPFAIAPVALDTDAAVAPRRVDPIATGPPVYIRKQSLLC